jgi:hypothetical protein
MKIPLKTVVDLLHQTGHGALATHSLSMPGYPFATALPFATDQAHCPIFLLSHLAEHRHNLQSDARASLLIQINQPGEVEAGARVTLIGNVEQIAADDLLIARYLRFHPEAHRYLALQGFDFFRLTPQRLRLISGFGQMGWLEADDWCSAPALPLQTEAALLARCHGDLNVIGIDCYGVDSRRNGMLQRQDFERPLEATEVDSRLKQLGILTNG